VIEDQNPQSRKPILNGVGLIFGVAAGVVLLALTGNAVWVGLGLVFGAGFAGRG